MNESLSATNKQRFSRRIKEARIGDPVAQYDVALMYANGVGVGKDVEQAFSWTKASAEKGHTVAQYLLGSAYSSGLGTPKDWQKALFWFFRSYEHGNEKAALKLGRILSVEQSALAFQFLIDSAEKGLADAQLAVAESYFNAIGVKQDGRLALDWYRRAADQGLPGAQFALGQAYELGFGIAEDLAVSTQWYREAAARGHPGAQLSLDRLDALGNGRFKQSTNKRVGSRERRTTDARWIKYAAHGSAEDSYHLGVMFELGVSVEKSARQARIWFKKAAEAGNVDAQFALARSFESSDSDLSIAWYQKAAAQGYADAQVALAKLYLRGVGVQQHRMSAVNWYARAAAQGHAMAQFGLATLLQTETDTIVFDLLSGAAASGHSGAQCAMGRPLCERHRCCSELVRSLSLV